MSSTFYFKGKSTHQELFYMQRSGNFAHSYRALSVPNTYSSYIVVRFQVFLSNIYNSMVSSNYFYLIIVIGLHIVTWFHETNNRSKPLLQVTILNITKLHTVAWFHVFLSNSNTYMVSIYYVHSIIVIC